MSKVTPGPWTYGVRNDGSIWMSLGDYTAGPHYQADFWATEADARLMCTAPDLLRELQSLVGLCEIWIARGTLDRSDTVLDSARAAIVKARGETP